MIVTKSIKELNYNKNSVVTVGTFDGVHLGHQSIIKTLVGEAKENNYKSVVVTFEPHPREVVGKGPVYLLTTLNERIKMIEALEVDQVVVLEFTYQFSLQTAREFYENYIVKGIGVSKVVVGYDHTFGHDRLSNVNELLSIGNEYNFDVKIVKPISYEGDIVSSTKIRNLILNGNVDRAAKYLNRYYSINGRVVEGDHRGITLGFPTANIQPDHPIKLIPADGVYCVSIECESKYIYGMLNIGVRPTFSDNHKKIIEVNLFNYNGNLYGKEIKINFIKRLREENKYSSKEELIEQLKIDRNECIKIFSESQQVK